MLPTARRQRAATRPATDHPARTAAPTPAQRPRSPPPRPRRCSRPASPRPSSGSNATAHRVKCERITSARSRNRRSQPRTVSACTPSRPAIRRYASPATLATIAAPITDTSSWRRNRHTSGSSTCVPAHPRHRARRGRSHRSPARQRSTRCRACPHGPSTSRHDGQPSSPPTSSASTSATSAHTINIGCHLRHPREPSLNRQARGRALARSRTREACQPHGRHAADEQHHRPRPCRIQTALNIDQRADQ